MVEERERLLDESEDDEEENKQRQINKRRLCICCICCLIVLFILLILTMGTAIFRKLRSKETSSNDDCSEKSDPNKLVFPNNISELAAQNEKLCKSLTSNETCHDAENPSNIYIVKGEHNLTDEEACGVESILRLFPDKTIYLINFNKKEQTSYTKYSAKPNYLGLLLYLYKDRLQMVTADKKNFFKNTPLHDYAKKENDLVFVGMLLTAYKYGGLVASPDVVMTSRDLIECFPDETVVEPFVILSPQKCDDFLHYLMHTFSICGHISNDNLETVLTESVELFSQSQPHAGRRPPARRLNPSEISHDAREPSGSFLHIQRFKQGDDVWVSDLSQFCKQVVQAYLGIKINKMEVDEETNKIKSYILGNNCEIFSTTCKNTTTAK